jgi:hypothetical protein
VAQGLSALQLDRLQVRLPTLPGRAAQARQNRIVRVLVYARHNRAFPYRTTASNAATESDDISFQMLEIMG